MLDGRTRALCDVGKLLRAWEWISFYTRSLPKTGSDLAIAKKNVLYKEKGLCDTLYHPSDETKGTNFNLNQSTSSLIMKIVFSAARCTILSDLYVSLQGRQRTARCFETTEKNKP